MPRRIAGTIWAVRITMTLTEAEELQFSIPGTVCVYHHGGERAKGLFKEKPHYHIFYDAGREVSKEDVQALIKSNEIVTKYYKPSNGFWSVDTSTDYTLRSYWDYVWRDYPKKKQRLIWWSIAIPQLPDYPLPEDPGNLVYASAETMPAIVYVKNTKKSSLDKQKEFYEYCKEIVDRKKIPITQRNVCYMLIKYCEDKGFTPEASLSTWARYAYFNLLDKPERKEARHSLADSLASKFFPVY